MSEGSSNINSIFDIQRAMHHIISIVEPTRCTSVLSLFYFGMTLYVFQTVFLSIIRSSRLYIQRQAFVKQMLLSACQQADSSICWFYYRNNKFHCHFSKCSCADLTNEADWFIFVVCELFYNHFGAKITIAREYNCSMTSLKNTIAIKPWTCHLRLRIFNNMNLERESDGINKSDNGIVWHIEALVCFLHGYETCIKCSTH